MGGGGQSLLVYVFLQNSVTAASRRINCKGIKYPKKAKKLDKGEVNSRANCFITLKDNKANFLNQPTARLINPAENEIRRISKYILDQLNSKLCEPLKINE